MPPDKSTRPNMGVLLQVISQIPRSQSKDELAQKVKAVLSSCPYPSIYLISKNNGFKVESKYGFSSSDELMIPLLVNVLPGELETSIDEGLFIGEEEQFNKLPVSFADLLRQLEIFSAALIPVMDDSLISAVFLVATREKKPLSLEEMQLYLFTSDLVAFAQRSISTSQITVRRIAELEAITLVSQEISTLPDLPSIYKAIHARIRQSVGDVDFIVALYDAGTNSISIPYMREMDVDAGEPTQIEAFPLGEGLTSILIRTRQPLMIIEDTEKKAIALGAKIAGRAAKSWLGVPVLVSGEVIGALIIQDLHRENAFVDGDMRFLSTLATQVAGLINNSKLLEEATRRALQLQTAAEIARDISGSLDLGELLREAVALIRERFNFYHSAVFLIDPAKEYAVIREATGDAGNQMKRSGHKLKVGSKSIVGYVTGSGEPLIVNDTSHDATYYANPLLPDTRAEAALPLKVGPLILGALDVQSAKPYAFNKEAVDVLKILTDQLAVAVINSELFAETQEHLSQHRLLHHVTTAAASGTTLDEALSSAVQGLQVTLGGDRVAILLADKEKNILTVKAIAGYSEEVKQLTVPLGNGVTGWVALHQQPQRINDISKDPRYIQVGSNVRSELAVPLSYRGELLGVLNVESDQTGAYTENDEELLGTLGGSLAAIMANARLLEKIRHQVDNERLLYEVTSKIRRSTDIQTILATTTTELGKALGARRAQIKLFIGNESDQNVQEK